MKLYFAGPLFTTSERTDVGGIDWADGLVAIMDGPTRTPARAGRSATRTGAVVLVRTDFRDLAGKAGRYNPILAESATIRLDLPTASTTEVITAILEALSTIERGLAAGAFRRIVWATVVTGWFELRKRPRVRRRVRVSGRRTPGSGPAS